jgi:hypothetical protein
MASRFGRWRRVAVAMLVLSTAGVAQAEPTAAEKETARSLMSEGRSRRERNDLPGALESFRAADALMHVTTTGLEVARSQIALGQLVEARDTLRQVMRIPAKDSDPRPFVEARANAQAMDEDLASRIPGIRIVLRGAVEGSAPGVSVDGVTVPAAALGAPFKVNPGHHVVAAVSGAARAQQQVDVAERALQTVTIELPAAAKATVETVANERAVSRSPAVEGGQRLSTQSFLARLVAESDITPVIEPTAMPAAASPKPPMARTRIGPP